MKSCIATKIEIEWNYLVEAQFAGEGDAEVRNAGVQAIVAPIELRIPLEALVERPRERLRERVANGDPAAPERHRMAEIRVRRVALRRRPNVHHLPVIILLQNSDEVFHVEDGVVVAEDEPPHACEAEAEALGDDAGDAEARGVAGGVGVPEPGDVLGDSDRREVPVSVSVQRPLDGLLQPYVAAHCCAGPPPEPEEVFPVVEELRRAGDAEDNVAEGEFVGGGGSGGGVGWRRRGGGEGAEGRRRGDRGGFPAAEVVPAAGGGVGEDEGEPC